jgi:4-nitrophenyl phosphatase
MMFELDGLVLDMDGVLWRGAEPMPGLALFFETIRQRKIHFILATNNSTRTVDQYVEKLGGMGVRVRPEQVLTSAFATADHLLTLTGRGASVYAVGEVGLMTALESRGFQVTAQGADFVVAGLDRGLSYDKVAKAMELIGNGAQFIGTNPDLTFPTPDGPRPGAGSVLAAISAASGVEPVIVGKPQPLMFQQALTRLGTRPEGTAMVGDRLETDILGGIRAGLRTILVLSGVTQHEQLAQSPLQPDWVFEDIRALAAALAK